MSSAPGNRLRVAAVDYLNPAPLMWDFDHEPARSTLAARYDVYRTRPAQCADDLASGAAHIGLIPVASYATIPGLAVIPGCTIASEKRVRSILLVTRKHDTLDSISTVAADISSRASVAYAQILFRKFYQRDPAFLPHVPDLAAMLRRADAALLIGDPALLALENRAELDRSLGEAFEYCDLAEEWTTRTGLPWVSAFWAVRPEAIAAARLTPTQVTEDFVRSRDHGLAHINELVTEWTAERSPQEHAGSIQLPERTIRTYLTQNIHYVLDDECLAGLGLFYRYAAETGVLPPAPPLRLLG